jgi:cell division protease FtsH
MNLSHKNIFISIMIGFLLLMLFRGFNEPGSINSIDYSDFLKMVESKSVTQVTLQGNDITGLSSQGAFNTFAPKDSGLITLLKSKGVTIWVKPENGNPWFG